jgi:hypothetical protein
MGSDVIAKVIPKAVGPAKYRREIQTELEHCEPLSELRPVVPEN